MVQILAVHVQAAAQHENQIIAVRWYNPEDGQINVATVQVMLEFLQVQRGVAYTYNGRESSRIGVAPGPPPHLTIVSRGVGVQSLLSLPRF